MVVKAVRGRRRYIAFNLDASFTKGTLVSRLKEFAGEDAPYVVQCSNGWAIIRASPEDIEKTVSLVSDADPNSKSICTSGTLITLRKRYPILMELRPPARK